MNSYTINTGSDVIEKKINRMQYLVVAVILIILVLPPAVTWYINRTVIQVDAIRITDLKVLSPTEVCPGDVLRYEYHFHGRGEGTLVRDTTVWDNKINRTIIYSKPLRLILPGPMDQYLIDTYHIPLVYYHYPTGEMQRWEPGTYKRMINIGSPTRSDISTTSSFDFVIRKDCQDGEIPESLPFPEES